MFQCNSCNTEYGGIRGVVADVCPRCESVAGETLAPVIRLPIRNVQHERMDLALAVGAGLDRPRGADQITWPR
jgi:hypothetical protein